MLDDAYGIPATGNPTSPFGYSGQYTDTTTGLSNMRARWFQPQTGGFTTRDPAFARTDQAYSYAGGDPVNNTDPSGLMRIPDGGGGSPGATIYTCPESGCPFNVNDPSANITPCEWQAWDYWFNQQLNQVQAGLDQVEQELNSMNGDFGYSGFANSLGQGWHDTLGQHWRGTVQVVGAIAAVAAAATGVGALAEGSIDLGLLSSSLGAVSGTTDLPACFGSNGQHDYLGCAGAATGIVTGFAGGAGAGIGKLVESGAFAEGSDADLLGRSAGALGFSAGLGGLSWDWLTANVG